MCRFSSLVNFFNLSAFVTFILSVINLFFSFYLSFFFSLFSFLFFAFLFNAFFSFFLLFPLSLISSYIFCIRLLPSSILSTIKSPIYTSSFICIFPVCSFPGFSSAAPRFALPFRLPDSVFHALQRTLFSLLTSQHADWAAEFKTPRQRRNSSGKVVAKWWPSVA